MRPARRIWVALVGAALSFSFPVQAAEPWLESQRQRLVGGWKLDVAKTLSDARDGLGEEDAKIVARRYDRPRVRDRSMFFSADGVFAEAPQLTDETRKKAKPYVVTADCEGSLFVVVDDGRYHVIHISLTDEVLRVTKGEKKTAFREVYTRITPSEAGADGDPSEFQKWCRGQLSGLVGSWRFDLERSVALAPPQKRKSSERELQYYGRVIKSTHIDENGAFRQALEIRGESRDRQGTLVITANGALFVVIREKQLGAASLSLQDGDLILQSDSRQQLRPRHRFVRASN